MKLSYKITNKPIITTSQLVRAELEEAIFYLYKEDDVTSFEIKVVNPDIDLSSAIYKTENLKTVFKVSTNTTDIMVTDISVEDVPYYYEVKSSPDTVLSLKDITLSTNIEAIEYNGRILTNTYINNYEISDGTYIFSTPIIDSSSHNVTYYSDHILVSLAKKKDQTFYAKTRFDTNLTVSKVTDNSILLSSFYLKSRSNVSQFIEGDVVYLDKKELTTVESNFIKLKDKAFKISKKGYMNTTNNVLYIEDAYLTSQDVIVEYTAKRSSHILEIDQILYLKLINNSVVLSTASDYDIVITKKIDTTKLKIETNAFLNKHQFVLKPADYGFIYDGILSENKRKMLTKYFDQATIKNASEVVYLNIDRNTIFQEEFSSDFVVGISTKASVYKYLEDDYTIPQFDIKNSQYNRVSITDISKSFFTKRILSRSL